MRSLRIFFLTLLAAFFTFATGCGDDGGGTTKVECTTNANCEADQQCRFVSQEVDKGVCVAMDKCTDDSECSEGRKCNAFDAETSYCGYSDGEFAVASANLPDGTVGVEYRFEFEVTVDIAPFSFSLKDGETLPDGLSLSENGQLTGTPTTAGDYTFTVVALNGSADSEYFYGVRSAEATVSLTINDPSTDPCYPNPCTETNKEICTADGENYTCLCNVGFVDDGSGNCILDVIDPCDPNPCYEAHKTVCTDDNGTPVCSCDEGYTEDENGNCIEDVNNPCNPNPCDEAHKTVCTDDNGTAVCSCDEGYGEDENGDCIEIVGDPCDPNPCTDTNRTVCVQDGLGFICNCDDGYELEGDSCLIACPSNMQREGDQCVCYPGYAGDNCTECADGYTLSGGLCILDCSEDPNSELAEDGSSCVCKEGFYPNNDGLCVDPCEDAGCFPSEECVVVDEVGTTACYCNEEAGFVEDPISGECICAGDNVTMNEDGTACECDEGYVENLLGNCVVDDGTCELDQYSQDAFDTNSVINSTLDNASLLPQEDTTYENLTTQDDTCEEVEDWYKFEMVPAGTIVTVSIDFIDADGDLDLNLKDSENTTLDSSAGTSDNETVEYEVPEDMDIYVRVYYGENIYSMSVSFTTSPCFGVTCGDNEVCEEGTCVCDNGFFDNGSECVTPCDPNPCEELENSDGVCDAIDATTFTCGCDVGFYYENGVCNLIETTELPAGDTCEDAVVIPGNGIYTGTTAGYTNDFTDEADCVTEEEEGNDVVYQITVPAGQRVDLTLDTDAPTTDWIIMYLLSDCGAGTCVASHGTITGRAPKSITYENETDSDETLFLVIDSWKAENTLNYFLTVEIGEGPCANVQCNENSHCFEGECVCDENFFANDMNECVTPCEEDSCGSHAVCNAIDAETFECECEDGYFYNGFACVNPCDNVTCGDNSVCEASNAIEYECVCDEGYVNLDGACVMPSGLQGGETCEDSVEITGPGVYSGSTLESTNEVSDASCGSATSPEVVYHFTATENQLVSVYLTGNTTFDSVLYARSDCADTTTQLDCSDKVGTGGERVQFITEVGVTYFIFVDGYLSTNSGDYEMVFELLDNPCESCDPNSEVCEQDYNDVWSCECADGFFEDENGVCLNPCEGDPCSDSNATCVGSTATEFTCECDEDNGYFDDGTGTGADIVCVQTCATVTCDDPNAACVASGATDFTCECDAEAGYYDDGTGTGVAVVCVNPCDTNICNDMNAVCNPSSATDFTCECDAEAGYFNDGTGTGIDVVCVDPCEGADVCPEDSTCIGVALDQTACQCDVGFAPHFTPDGTYLDPREGTTPFDNCVVAEELQGGNSCDEAIEITTPGVYSGTTDADGIEDVETGSCAGTTTVPDLYYTVTFDEPVVLFMALNGKDVEENLNNAWDTVLWVKSGTSCEESEQIFCTDDSDTYVVETTGGYVNVEPGTYYIVVDGNDQYGWPGVGDYELTIDWSMPCEVNDCDPTSEVCSPTGVDSYECVCNNDAGYIQVGESCVLAEQLQGGETCQDSIEITQSGVYVGSTVDALNDVSDATCGSATSPEVVYHFTATANDLVTFELGDGTDFDSVLYVRTDCEDTATQVGCDDNGGDGTEIIQFIAEEGVTYYVFVDGYQETNSGNYSLLVDIQANPCDSCDPNSEICAQDGEGVWGCACADGYFEDENGACVTPCDPNPCVAVPNSTGVCEATSLENYTCECADGFGFSMEGDMPMCVAIGGEGDEICSVDAPVIDHSGVWIGDTSDNTNDHELKAGNDVVYMLTLTEHSNVEIWLHSENYDTYLYLNDDCDPTSTTDVLYYNDDDSTYGTSTRNSLITTTEPLAPGDYFIFVDGYSSTANGEYQLTVTINPEQVEPCGDGVIDPLTEECDPNADLPYNGQCTELYGDPAYTGTLSCDPVSCTLITTECVEQTVVTIDWCNTQYPELYDENNLVNGDMIYGQVYSADGNTLDLGAAEGISAELCYYADGTDIADATCVPAAFNTDSGNNDEYGVVPPFQPNDNVYYFYRFSGDNGNSWTNCDLTGTDDGFDAPNDLGLAMIGTLPGDTFENPIVVNGSQTYTGTTSLYTNDYTNEAGCITEVQNGQDMVFQITLPVGGSLSASLITDNEMDWVNLHLVNSVTPTVCEAFVSDDTIHPPIILDYMNQTAEEQVLYLVMDTYSSAIDYTLNLTIEGGELPTNGDFESWNGGILNDWMLESGIEVTQDTVNFHSGSSSAILTRTSSSNGDVEITSNYIPVIADTAYHISAWFLDMTSSARGRLAVEWFDADTNYISNYYGPYSSGDDLNVDWEELTADQTAPANAAYMRVFFRVYGDNGSDGVGFSVNIDNVTVTAQ